MTLEQHHILIVEDEFFIAVELEFILREAGAEVVGPAMSAAEALRLIDDHRITLAILDRQLDRHDSLPVARRLVDCGIPFVFYTGNPLHASSERDWPRAPVIKKPAAPLTLIAALAAVARQ